MAKPFRTFICLLMPVLSESAAVELATTVASESRCVVCSPSCVGEDAPAFSAALSAGVRLRILNIDGRAIPTDPRSGVALCVLLRPWQPPRGFSPVGLGLDKQLS